MREPACVWSARKGADMKELTRRAVECARANRAMGIAAVDMGIYGTDEVIIDLAAEIDQLRAKEETVKGPSTEALCGHHLTEAIRHLAAAAEFSRELGRPDAGELALSLERAVEAALDIRRGIEGTKP